METVQPLFSVIVPVRDGGEAFERCLKALSENLFEGNELIVVDDGSTDDSARRARRFGATVLTLEHSQGPAAARNLGARHARGRFLFFVDADCVVHDDTLQRAAAALETYPDIDAVFGSYDDAPAGSGFAARFKNLVHAYTHRTGSPAATTFWAGCGVVRKVAFDAVDGFDAERYPRPSIEDIELGYRLRDAGYRIRLSPEVRVKHLKEWTLIGMVRTDVLDRGIPWTRLMLDRGGLDPTLNTRWSERISGLLAWGVALAAPGALFAPALMWVAAASGALLLVLQRRLYHFLFERCGLWFTLWAIPMHWLYYLYAGLAFAIGAARHVIRRLAWTAPTLLGLVFVHVGPIQAQQPSTCTVAFVVDGDEFHCRSGEKIRLLLVDAPERGRFGAMARRGLAAVLPVGKEVRYELDRVTHDGKERLLAYVFLSDGRMVNEMLLQHGYVFLKPNVENRLYTDRLREAEAVARRDARGVWAR